MKNRRFYITMLLTILMSVCARAQEDNTEKIYPLLTADSTEFSSKFIYLRHEEVAESLNTVIEKIKKRRRNNNTEEQEKQLEMCDKGIQYLKGTDQVLIIDSIVVDKEQFLSGYRFSNELGNISANGETTVFETERGNMQYTAIRSGSKGKLQLVSQYKEDGKLSSPTKLTGIDMNCDVNYPFMTTDGVSFYFAARSEEGLGNYDLYATRYDSERNRFYKPDNMGLPYNSYANDYMMVIDEANEVGWFASDRYQPEGKVCIYTFIPNKSRRTYDYENIDHETIRKAATMEAVKETWTNDNRQERIAARQRISLSMTTNNTVSLNDFVLVINDLYTYFNLDDFQSEEAKKECKVWLEKRNNLTSLKEQLQKLRDEYATGNNKKRKEIRSQILDMEQRAEELTYEVKEAEKRTRNLEVKKLK